MSTFSGSLRCGLLLGTCLAGAVQAQAQNTGDGVAPWVAHGELVARPGSYETGAGAELFVPLAQGADNLLFFDGRLGATTRSDWVGNLGLGIRHVAGPDLVVGGYVFADATRTEAGNDFWGATVGAELLTGAFDLRANFHIPLSDEQLVSDTVGPSVLSVTGNRLVESFSTARIEEAAMYGIDAEAGVRLFGGEGAEFRLYGAVYHYWADRVASVTGGRGRAELRLNDVLGGGSYLALGAEVSEDDQRGTEFAGDIRLRIPFGGAARADAPRMSPIRRRAAERVRRELSIRMGDIVTGGSFDLAAINAATGQAFGPIFFADGANTLGSGDPGDPTTLDDAVARAGANGIIVGEGNNGTLLTGGVTLAGGQTLVGGGTDVQVRLQSGAVQPFTLGETPGTISNSGMGATITAGAGSTIRNLSLTGGATGISGSGISGVTIDNVTISGVGGTGIALDNAGAVTITDSNVTGGASGALSVTGNTQLALTGGTYGSSGGNVIELDGTGATLTVTALGDLIIEGGNGETGGLIATNVVFDDVEGGDLVIGSAAGRIGGDGLFLDQVAGDLSLGELSVFTDGGTGLYVRDAGGKAGSFAFGNDSGSIDAQGGTAIDVDPVTLDMTLASVTSTGSPGAGLLFDTVAGSFTVTGTTSVTGSAGPAISIANSPATFSFGATVITDPGSDGIVIAGTNGAISFGDTDITGLGAATGVDLRTAIGNVTFATLDIAGTGAAGSRGIDMRGSTNSGDIVTSDSGDITGVDIGVDLSNANITGIFQYGDGSDTDADGAASTITATTPILATNLGITGTYNFLDTLLVGDTSGLSDDEVTIFFVDSTAGAGTAADPGTIQQAEASGADIIVLVNDGLGALDAAGSGADDTLLLGDGQRLTGFFGQSSFDYVQGGPQANLMIHGFAAGQTITVDDPSGNGAATLVSSLGDALTLSGNNMVDHVAIGTSAGFGVAIDNVSGAVMISSATTSSIGVDGGSATIGLASTTLTGSAGRVLAVTGGHSGTLTIDAASSIADTTGTGIAFDGAQGSYTIAAPIGLSGGGILINASPGSFAFNGTVTIANPVGDAIVVAGTNGDIDFGDVDITGLGAATGVDLTGVSGDVTFASLDIGGTGAAGSKGIDLSGSTNAGDIVTTNPSSIAGVDIGVDISNANITGTFQFGDGSDVDANGKASTILANTGIDATGVNTATGTYNFLDVDFGGANPGGATGIFTVPTFYYFTQGAGAGLADGSSAANAGSVAGAESAGVDALILVGAAANAVDVTDTLSLDAGQQLLGFADGEDTIDLGIAGPANILVSASLGQATNLHTDGSPNLTLAAPGTVITLADGNTIRNIGIDNTGGGALIGISGNSINNFIGSDIAIDGATSGIFFTGATGTLMLTGLTVNATSGIGVNLTVNPLATFTFNSLDVTMTSGTGFSADSGGTINLTGNNSVATATGRILNLSGVIAGASGMSFASLTGTGTIGTTAILIDNLDGTSFDGGTVSIAGTSGIGSDGIFIGGGSAASFDFGATTIGATGEEGIELNGTNGAVTFASATIDGSGGQGLAIIGATNAVAINGGDIGSSVDVAGNTVFVQNSSGAITIGANLFKSGGNNVAFVDNFETGTLTFSGAIDSISNGIAVLNSNSGTVDFTGAATLDTGGGDAVQLINNPGGTINFSGRLDITTTSGRGIRATGGGIVNFTGTNTVTTAGGRAINLENMTIGDLGMTFDSVDVTNGEFGIFLFQVGQTATSAGIDVLDGTITVNQANGEAVRIEQSSADIFIGADLISTGSATRAVQVTDSGRAGGQAIEFAGLIDDNTTGIVVQNNDQNGGIATVTFSGTVDIDTVAGASWGFLARNGGNVIVTGSMTIDTLGATVGIELTDNAGSTITFNSSGAGLDVVTAAGTGLAFTGGGTLTILGSSNSITTTNGTIIDFANGAIGAGGVDFALLTGTNVAGGLGSFGISLDTLSGGTIAANMVNITGGGAGIFVTGGANVDFGTVTLTNPQFTGIVLDGSTGMLNFGDTTITSPDTAGVAIIGASGPVGFDSLTISLDADNSVGVSLNGATLGANVTAIDFDLTSTSANGTIGIDLRGATGIGAVTFGDTSMPFASGEDATIAGVAIGVILDDASAIDFIFGDGESAADVDSVISATVAIDFTNATGANGTFNFLDVTYPVLGSTNNLESGIDIFYADAGLDGTDNGSRTNPGQLDNAAAGTADVIVLVNQNAGGTDTIDLASGNQGGINSFTLNDGQLLVSFNAGETIDLADYGIISSGAPSNILLTGIAAGGTLITNPGAGMGAPILTTSAAGANVITLAGGSTTQIGGIVIGATAGANAGIFGNNFLGVTIRDSMITGTTSGLLFDFAANGAANGATVLLEDSEFVGGSANGVTVTSGAGDALAVEIDQTEVASNAGAGLSIISSGTGSALVSLAGVTANSVSGAGISLSRTGAGTFTIAEFSGIAVETAGAGGVLIAGSSGTNEISFDSDPGTIGLQPVAAGDIAIGSPGSPVTGAGLSLVNVAGTLNFGDFDIETTGGTGLEVNNSALKTAQLALSLTLTSTGGTINSVAAPALFLDPLNTDLVLDSVTSTNSTTDGIFIDEVTGVGAGGNALTIGTLNIVTPTGRGVVVQASSGGYTFGNPTITDTGGIGVLINGGSSAVNFLAGGGGLTQTVNATALNITGGHTGSLTWSTGIDVTNGNGLQFGNADGIYLFDADDGNPLTRAISLHGGTAAIGFGTSSGGTFTFGADTEIVDPQAIAFSVGTSTATINYAGTITQNNAFNAINITNHLTGTITFSGLITANTAGANPIQIQNTNAGARTINFIGGMDLTTLGTGINIVATTPANGANKIYNFTGTNNITVNAGSGIGISMTNATIGDLGATFSTVNVNNASFGLNLSNVLQTAGSSGIDVLGGNITTSTQSVSMTGSTADLSVAANLTSTTGRTVNLASNGRAGGQAIVFSGNIDDNGTGISLNNNDQNGGTATVTVSGDVDIDISSGTSGFLATNGGNVVVTGPMNVNVTGGAATANGVNLTGNAGSTISFNSSGAGLDIVTGGTGIGLQMTGGGTLEILGSGNSITTNTGRIVNLVGSDIGAGGVTFASLTSTGTIALGTNQAVLMFDNVDGTGTFNGGTVNIAGSTGNTGDGIRFQNGSAANFSFGATTIGSAGDDGIDIAGTNGAITFASTTISNTGTTSLSSGHGIVLTDALGTVTINGGTITNGGGNGVDISGNTGTVTIGAGITKTNATGLLVNVVNHDAGTVDFSGNLSANGGAGIAVSSSNGGSITFSGASKTLNTGTNIAVNLQSNAGSTVSFTNGGLDIDTTTGTGLNITSGTVNILGAGNSITTQTGQPIAVSTSADAILLDLDFDSVSTTGTSTQGMDFRATGTGTIGGSVDIAGGSITTNGRGLRLDNTTLNFSYGGNLTANVNALFRRAFEIANHSSGDIVLSGNIVDTANGSTITNMTGGSFTHSGNFNAGVVGATAPLTISNVNPSTATISFTGASKIFNQSGVGIAPNGATVNFTGGGLAIDTTSNTGLSFAGNGNLTVSGAGNSVTTTTGTGVSIVGGMGNVSINSNVTTTTGLVASISGRTGGSVLLSGALSGNNIQVNNNSGGTIDFTGNLALTGTIQMNSNSGGATIGFSGASKAISGVTMNSNTGATVNFSGGGLNVGAAGIRAENGGTLTVTGSGNTINTVSTHALFIENTAIGAAGLTFQSVSAGNDTAAPEPLRGIHIFNTGDLGGLKITGTGTPGSGGTIQNTTNAGIWLVNTGSVSISWMNITGVGAEGITYNANSGTKSFIFTNNVFSNIFFPLDIVVGAIDPGTVLNTDIRNNSGLDGIQLNEFGGQLTITQASLAALAADNPNATIFTSDPIDFNTPAPPPPF